MRSVPRRRVINTPYCVTFFPSSQFLYQKNFQYIDLRNRWEHDIWSGPIKYALVAAIQPKLGQSLNPNHEKPTRRSILPKTRTIFHPRVPITELFYRYYTTYELYRGFGLIAGHGAIKSLRSSRICLPCATIKNPPTPKRAESHFIFPSLCLNIFI